MAEAHHITKKKYWQVFALLMVLLFLTVFIAYMHIDPWLAIIAAMTIAIVKAVLVILYFMHVRYNSRLTWLFVMAGFFWLLLMIGITMTDYKTRDWDHGGYNDEIDSYSSPYGLPATMYPQNRPGADPHRAGDAAVSPDHDGDSPAEESDDAHGD